MRIHVTCDNCGTIELSEHDLTLRICTDNQEMTAFRFRCIQCGSIWIRPTDQHSREILDQIVPRQEVWQTTDIPDDSLAELGPIDINETIDLYRQLSNGDLESMFFS